MRMKHNKQRPIKNEKYFHVPLHKLLPLPKHEAKKELDPDFGKRNDFGIPITGLRTIFSK